MYKCIKCGSAATPDYCYNCSLSEIPVPSWHTLKSIKSKQTIKIREAKIYSEVAEVLAKLKSL